MSIRFQVLFHSPHGVLFTFPSRYWFTIGRQGVFSLGGWSPRIPTRFHVPRGTRDPRQLAFLFIYRTFTFYGRPFQTCSIKKFKPYASPSTPAPKCWFGLFPLRSPLLGESIFLSFPPGTEMFQFPGFPSTELCIHSAMTGLYSSRVSPFGYLRINACLRLPVAFRSLPRPSSASGARASSLCSCSLDLFPETL